MAGFHEVLTNFNVFSRSLSHNAERAPEPPNRNSFNLMLSDHMHRVYRFEINRRRSFYKHGQFMWSLARPSPTALASAGFFYTEHRDVVQCFECRVRIGGWSLYMKPWLVHRETFPKCKFLSGKLCGNVPVDTDSSSIPPMERSIAEVIAEYHI